MSETDKSPEAPAVGEKQPSTPPRVGRIALGNRLRKLKLDSPGLPTALTVKGRCLLGVAFIQPPNAHLFLGVAGADATSVCRALQKLNGKVGTPKRVVKVEGRWGRWATEVAMCWGRARPWCLAVDRWEKVKKGDFPGVTVNIPVGRLREVNKGLDAVLSRVQGGTRGPQPGRPGWLTADVLNLALAAFGNRDPATGAPDATHLGVLADALEDAGYPDGAGLAHLRGAEPGLHGAWVVGRCLGAA